MSEVTRELNKNDVRMISEYKKVVFVAEVAGGERYRPFADTTNRGIALQMLTEGWSRQFDPGSPSYEYAIGPVVAREASVKNGRPTFMDDLYPEDTSVCFWRRLISQGDSQ